MSDSVYLAPTSTLFNADTLVGIVVALPEELATLTRIKLKQGECCRVGNTWIAYSGAGLINAASAAELLVNKGARQLISWGCAAGLSIDTKPGDLVIATQAIDEHQQFDTDKLMVAALKQILPVNLNVHQGKLFSSGSLVGLSQDKKRIHQHSLAIALDMESTAIANTARHAQLPFMIIRSIADPVEMNLPIAVIQALNDNGQVDLPKLLSYLVWHPLEIAALIKLGLHFQAAKNTLKIVAMELQRQQTAQIRPAD
ncbi:MAG: phosphorylase [Methylomonas lenta]|nr:phosphorylase [Methylomonas lenta]